MNWIDTFLLVGDQTRDCNGRSQYPVLNFELLACINEANFFEKKNCSWKKISVADSVLFFLYAGLPPPTTTCQGKILFAFLEENKLLS